MNYFIRGALHAVGIILIMGFLFCFIFPLGGHLAHEWNVYLDRVLP